MSETSIVAKPVQVELGKLNFAPYNPRKMPSEQMTALKGSIKEHGFVQPLVVQREGNVLIAGHQRVRALRELCKETKQALPKKVYAVVLDLPDSQAKRLNIQLNRISGEFDDAMLVSLLSDVALVTPSLDGLGFSAEQLENLLGSYEEPPKLEDECCEEDDDAGDYEDEWKGKLELPEYKPPFPWFGGKSRVAERVWKRFGEVKNYVEPFFGSGATLFRRPGGAQGIETVNDIDCYVANFWRAVSADADSVAKWCDWPVNEADLHARHNWLGDREEFRKQMHSDPDYFDLKIAGWWVWGICSWIGGGWCTVDYQHSTNLPHLGNAGRGIHRANQLPHLGSAGQGLTEYFASLQTRLRRVRVCCGDWQRVLSSCITTGIGMTGVFLDPPYAADDRADVYSQESFTIARDVERWCIQNGDDPLLRIALCGYEDEHDMPKSWTISKWKAAGGYSKHQTRGNTNRLRERIWFSPHCLRQPEAP